MLGFEVYESSAMDDRGERRPSVASCDCVIARKFTSAVDHNQLVVLPSLLCKVQYVERSLLYALIHIK